MPAGLDPGAWLTVGTISAIRMVFLRVLGSYELSD
jgi:hypothetical protein